MANYLLKVLFADSSSTNAAYSPPFFSLHVFGKKKLRSKYMFAENSGGLRLNYCSDLEQGLNSKMLSVSLHMLSNQCSRHRFREYTDYL